MATVRAGDLIGAGWGVLTRQWRWLVGGGMAVGAFQALQKGVEAQNKGVVGVILVMSLLVMVAQFIAHAVIARKAMEAEALVMPGTPARYGHYLLASAAVTLGAFLGAIVLVVPGIMAMLRWFVSTNYVLARGMSCTQALAASRDATRGHRWTLLWAWLVLVVALGAPYLVMVWATGGLAGLEQTSAVSALGVARLLWTVVATAISVAFSIGVYGVLATRSNTLSDVFS